MLLVVLALDSDITLLRIEVKRNDCTVLGPLNVVLYMCLYSANSHVNRPFHNGFESVIRSFPMPSLVVVPLACVPLSSFWWLHNKVNIVLLRYEGCW